MTEVLDDPWRYCAERTLQTRAHPRGTRDVISAALAAEEHARWDLVVLLHFRATPDVLQAARELCISECADERILGADILGQLGIPDRAFPDECVAALLPMLDTEQDPDVLCSVCVALGHLHDGRAVEKLVLLKDHPDPNVRFHLAIALEGQTAGAAIQTLIGLSADEDADVRDWATFALGTQTDEDTPAIREALLERLTDSDAIARGEAMVGLARRKDGRVLPALLKELEPEQMARLEVRPDLPLEAAEKMGDAQLLPVLQWLQCLSTWRDDPLLVKAIESCQTDANSGQTRRK
jgi:HEAT repeat protein